MSIEYIEHDPTRIRVIKKTIFTDNGWKQLNFYVISYKSQTYDWLLKYYGKSIYIKTWWKVFDKLAMNEEIYLHWKLAEE